MNEYKYEMHMHTCPCSGGGTDVETHIDDLIRKGFAGMVITNHFYKGDTRIERGLPWQEFVAAFEQDFLRAKAYAADKDFDVLFGIEENNGDGREMLIYGITPEFLASRPYLRTCTLAEYVEAVHAAGGLIYQAHPYRRRAYIITSEPFAEIEIFDGIEGWNAANALDENEDAMAFAKARGLAMVAGSDAHAPNSAGRAGIATSVRIRDNQTLVSVLRSGNYTIYKE